MDYYDEMREWIQGIKPGQRVTLSTGQTLMMIQDNGPDDSYSVDGRFVDLNSGVLMNHYSAWYDDVLK